MVPKADSGAFLLLFLLVLTVTEPLRPGARWGGPGAGAGLPGTGPGGERRPGGPGLGEPCPSRSVASQGCCLLLSFFFLFFCTYIGGTPVLC